MEMGHFQPSADNLAAINKAALDKAFEVLSIESSYFARWDEFQREGVRPTDVGRPELDEDHLRSLEMKRAPFGLGSYNPTEVMWGGTIDKFDDFQRFIGYTADGKSSIQEVTGSDDDRLRVVPWGPLARNDKGSAPNYGPGANGWGRGGDATPLHAALSKRSTKDLGMPGQTYGKIRY